MFNDQDIKQDISDSYKKGFNQAYALGGSVPDFGTQVKMPDHDVYKDYIQGWQDGMKQHERDHGQNRGNDLEQDLNRDR